MGRNLIRSCGLLVAVGLACQSAQAGERKSEAARSERAFAEVLIPSQGRSSAPRHDVFGFSSVKAFDHSTLGFGLTRPSPGRGLNSESATGLAYGYSGNIRERDRVVPGHGADNKEKENGTRPLGE